MTASPPPWMRDAFIDVQTELALKLRRATGSISHPGVKGTVNEEHWIDILRAYLPNRYQVDTAIVIDHTGGRSDQMDVVIYDRQYTPTLLDQKSHRYVPAEAVYAVFECKPHIDKAYLAYAGDKAASVRRLARTAVPIVHAGGVTQPRPPFPIVAGLLAAKADWSEGLGHTFRQHLPTGEALLDCGCALDHGGFDTHDGSLTVFGPDVGLIRFLFRLLGRLQSLGTVSAIDWNAYAASLDAPTTTGAAA